MCLNFLIFRMGITAPTWWGLVRLKSDCLYKNACLKRHVREVKHLLVLTTFSSSRPAVSYMHGAVSKRRWSKDEGKLHKNIGEPGGVPSPGLCTKNKVF